MAHWLIVRPILRALDRALERAGLPGVGLKLGTQMVGHGAGALVEQAVRHVTNDDTITMKSPLCRLLLSVFLEEYEPICAETSVLYSGATESSRHLTPREAGRLVTNKPRRFVELMLPAFVCKMCLTALLRAMICRRKSRNLIWCRKHY